MKIYLKPLYSQQNPDSDTCPLGCQGQCRVKQLSTLGQDSNAPCPLSVHQVETYQKICDRTQKPKVIFNTSATGDGKSLGAYLPGLVAKYRIVGLYPTIELVKDQEKQIKKYHQLFSLDSSKR
jgi:CRISPR-associated endonuclease/helicase Cas3